MDIKLDTTVDVCGRVRGRQNGRRNGRQNGCQKDPYERPYTAMDLHGHDHKRPWTCPWTIMDLRGPSIRASKKKSNNAQDPHRPGLARRRHQPLQRLPRHCRDGRESIPGTGGLRYLYLNRDGGPAGLRQWSMGALVLRESLSRGVSTRGNRIHRAEKQSHTKRRDLYKT